MAAGGDRPQGIEQRLNSRQQLTKQHPPQPRRQLPLGRIFSRQQPQGQGAVGNQTNAQLIAQLLQPQLRHRIGGQQRILHLEGRNGYSPRLKPLVGQRQPLGAKVRQPHRLDLPLGIEIHQPVQKRPLLPGGIVGRRPMHLHQINGATQTLRRSRPRPHHRPSGQPPGIGRQLSCQTESVSIGPGIALGKLAQQGFAAAIEPSGAVGVTAVKQGDAVAEAVVKHLAQLAIHGGGIAPQQPIAPGPGAAAHLGQGDRGRSPIGFKQSHRASQGERGNPIISGQIAYSSSDSLFQLRQPWF